VPALRRLDLSRNDGPAPNRIFDGLTRIAIKRQLTHLCLPPIRIASEHAFVQQAISRMPNLVEIRVATFAPLQHATARVIAP
jgi:hypothetical protein